MTQIIKRKRRRFTILCGIAVIGFNFCQQIRAEPQELLEVDLSVLLSESGKQYDGMFLITSGELDVGEDARPHLKYPDKLKGVNIGGAIAEILLPLARLRVNRNTIKVAGLFRWHDFVEFPSGRPYFIAPKIVHIPRLKAESLKYWGNHLPGSGKWVRVSGWYFPTDESYFLSDGRLAKIQSYWAGSANHAIYGEPIDWAEAYATKSDGAVNLERLAWPILAEQLYLDLNKLFYEGYINGYCWTPHDVLSAISEYYYDTVWTKERSLAVDHWRTQRILPEKEENP